MTSLFFVLPLFVSPGISCVNSLFLGSAKSLEVSVVLISADFCSVSLLLLSFFFVFAKKEDKTKEGDRNISARFTQNSAFCCKKNRAHFS